MFGTIHSYVYYSKCAESIRRKFSTFPIVISCLFYLLYIALCTLFVGMAFWLLFACKHFQPQPMVRFSLKNHSDDVSYLVYTNSCYLPDWPVFDKETLKLFESHLDQDFGCDSAPPIAIRRVNFTWIEIDHPANSSWSCKAQEIHRTAWDDDYEFGPDYPLKNRLTNFADQQFLGKSRWDAVLITCRDDDTMKAFNQILPLVQHYQPQVAHRKNATTTNILLVGIDSVSRLNFLRHMIRTKELLDGHGFIPLNGHHKVGENTYPNMFAIFTGIHMHEYCSRVKCDGAKYDDAPLIFKEFRSRGYLTTFIEDLPTGAIFNNGYTDSEGFDEAPAEYYLRPTSRAIYKYANNEFCYRGALECELYYNFTLDQMEAFRDRDNQPYFTFSIMGAMTHDDLNGVGWFDRPFSRYISRIFDGGHHENTMIIAFADHAFRGHDSDDLISSFIHEARLPFIYIYIPDSMTLNGMDARQLREIVTTNQHRLTSHFDVHATLMHVLTGELPTDEPYGLSLLAPIPTDRTCEDAGILPQFCLCSITPTDASFTLLPLRDVEHMNEEYTPEVVRHMNRQLALYAPDNSCVPLQLSTTFKAYYSWSNRTTTHANSADETSQVIHLLLHFGTMPNNGTFEAMLQLTPNHVLEKVLHVTRTNKYGRQSHCVKKYQILQFCLCRDMLANEENLDD